MAILVSTEMESSMAPIDPTVRTARCACVALACAGLLSGCAQPSLVTGSAYLFAVDVREEKDDLERGRLGDPYDDDAKGAPISPGENVLISLNRVWLRYLQDVEANILIYVEVFPDPDPDAKFAKILFQRAGMPQNAFTGQTDAVIWGPARVSDNPLRVRLYVVELNRDQDRSLFESISSAAASAAGVVAGPAAQSIAASALGRVLLSMKQDSIELAYDVTFVPERAVKAAANGEGEPRDPRLVLPLRVSQFAVIKGESLYRNAPYPSFLVNYGIPFNWFGMTIAPVSQKREVRNENEENELFQFGRYGEEVVFLRPFAWVGEFIYSVVRLPFYAAYMLFRRPATRASGTSPEDLIWRDGELHVLARKTEGAGGSGEGDAAPPGRRESILYSEKSYAVFSITRASVDLRSFLVRASERHAKLIATLTNVVGIQVASAEDATAVGSTLRSVEVASRNYADSVALSAVVDRLAGAADIQQAERELVDGLSSAGFEGPRIKSLIERAKKQIGK